MTIEYVQKNKELMKKEVAKLDAKKKENVARENIK